MKIKYKDERLLKNGRDTEGQYSAECSAPERV